MKHLKYMFLIAVLASSCQTFDPPDDQPLEDIPGIEFDFKGKGINFNTSDNSYFNYTWIENLAPDVFLLNSELRSVDCQSACPNTFRFSALVSKGSRSQILADPELALNGSIISSIDTFGTSFEYTFTINYFGVNPIKSILWTVHDLEKAPQEFHDKSELIYLDKNYTLSCVEVLVEDVFNNYTRNILNVPGLTSFGGNDAPYISYQRQAGGVEGQLNFPNAPYFFNDQLNEEVVFIQANPGDPVMAKYEELQGVRIIEDFFVNDADSSGRVNSISSQLNVDLDVQFSPMGSDPFIDYSMLYIDENNETWIALSDSSSSVKVIGAKRFVDNEFGDPTILMELDITSDFVSIMNPANSVRVTNGTVFVALPL